MDCPSTPGAPLFPFTLTQASQTSSFEIRNGLPDAFSSSTRLLPALLVDRMNNSHGRPGSFAPPPLQGPRHYYGPVRQRARQRYSAPYGALPAQALPLATAAAAVSG